MIVSTMNSKKGKDAPFDVRAEMNLDQARDILAGLETLLDLGHGGKRRADIQHMAVRLRLVIDDVAAKAARR